MLLDADSRSGLVVTDRLLLEVEADGGGGDWLEGEAGSELKDRSDKGDFNGSLAALPLLKGRLPFLDTVDIVQLGRRSVETSSFREGVLLSTCVVREQHPSGWRSQLIDRGEHRTEKPGGRKRVDSGVDSLETKMYEKRESWRRTFA